MKVSRVCVYCASSSRADALYYAAAYQLGRRLAEAGVTVVYGGGGHGSMGRLADGALDSGGQVFGILPQFMHDIEWGHKRLTELRLVDSLHTRKRLLLEGSDAVVALPGGSGTFEELFEVITLKRLGLYVGPIILVNTRDFFEPFLRLMGHCVAEQFMDPRHLLMWQVVETPEQVMGAIVSDSPWSSRARDFAVLKQDQLRK